jgi:hypothetical protein
MLAMLQAQKKTMLYNFMPGQRRHFNGEAAFVNIMLDGNTCSG